MNETRVCLMHGRGSMRWGWPIESGSNAYRQPIDTREPKRVSPWSSRNYDDLASRRAVVLDIALATDGLYTGTIVVGPRTRRCCQPDQFENRAWGGQSAHRARAYLGVVGGDRRVGREIVAHCRRWCRCVTSVVDRDRQGEGLTWGRIGRVHRRRRGYQIWGVWDGDV